MRIIVYALFTGLSLLLLIPSSQAGLESVRAGVQVEHVAYEESGVMEEKGFLVGVFADIDIAEIKELELSLFAAYVFGTLDYDSASSSKLDLHATNPNTILDLRLEAAYSPDMAAIMNLFVGMGYRRLTDDLDDIGDLKGYERVQHYIYIPLGIQFTLPAPEKWTVTGILEYDLFVKGYNESRQSSLEQNAGYGYRASVLCERAMASETISQIQIEPFMQYWDIEQSTLDRGFYEPENNSTMLGIRVALGF